MAGLEAPDKKSRNRTTPSECGSLSYSMKSFSTSYPATGRRLARGRRGVNRNLSHGERFGFGAPGAIRTHDLRFRKPPLYPTELRGQHRVDTSVGGRNAEERFGVRSRTPKRQRSRRSLRTQNSELRGWTGRPGSGPRRHSDVAPIAFLKCACQWPENSFGSASTSPLIRSNSFPPA